MKSMDIIDIHEILSSIFPEKLKFDGKNCRTPNSSKVLDLILTIDGASRDNKKRDKLKNLGLSLRVEPADLLSNSFLENLNKITTIYRLLKNKK